MAMDLRTRWSGWFGRPALKGLTLFDSYEQARDAASPQGYSNERVTSVVAEKTRIYRDRQARERSPLSPYDLQVLLAVATARGGQAGQDLHVLDVGGACGAHYVAARTCLPSIPLRWTVVETPAMAEKASALWADEPRVAFASQLDQAAAALGRVDLVVCCGTLHCVDSPHQLLDQLCGVGAPFLLINRAALSAGRRDLFCVAEHKIGSNGPGPLPAGFEDGAIRYAYFHPDRDAIRSRMSRIYDLVWEARERSPRFDAVRYPIELTAYFGRRRDGSAPVPSAG